MSSMNWMSAMEPRQVSGHHDEPRAGDPPRRFKIHAQALADGHMILRLEVERSRLAPAAHFDIADLVAAVRDARMQDIGQPQLQVESSACIRSSCLRLPAISTPKRLARAPAEAPRPALGLGLPHALALALRSARNRSASICRRLRCSSRAAKTRDVEHEAAARQLGGHPGKSLRSSFGSSTLFLPRVGFLRYCRRGAAPHHGDAFLAPNDRESRARRAASASPILISRPRGAGT
jgi:hypothetical protein